MGAAHVGDALRLLERVPNDSINLIVTSPPFALRRRKDYGNPEPEKYVRWFTPFAGDFHRVLKDDGSLVLHVGGAWNRGSPTKSLYQFELLRVLCERFHLAQDFAWYNPSRLPTPAQWVTVRRTRVKDAFDYVWWLSKSENPKADNRRVLVPYSESMKRLLRRGDAPARRPSGHVLSGKFARRLPGAIPPNVLVVANTRSGTKYLRECRKRGVRPHPARWPREIPEFFIKMLTEPGDLVLDPFAGSNVTGAVAEHLGRRWLAFELVREYVEASRFRFDVREGDSRPLASVRHGVSSEVRSLPALDP